MSLAVGCDIDKGPDGRQVQRDIDKGRDGRQRERDALVGEGIDLVVRNYNVAGGHFGGPATMRDRLQKAAKAFHADLDSQVGFFGVQEAGDRVSGCYADSVFYCFTDALDAEYSGVRPRPDARQRAHDGLGAVWDGRIWVNEGYPQGDSRPKLAVWELARRRKEEHNVPWATWYKHQLVGLRLRNNQTGWVVRVFVTHLANGGRPDRVKVRREQIRQVAAILDRQQFTSRELPPILIGDFNFCPPRDASTCSHANVEPDNYDVLNKRLWLPSKFVGGEPDPVVQVWLGRPSHFVQTRGDYELEDYARLALPGITDHRVPSLGLKIEGAQGSDANWTFDDKADGTVDRALRYGYSTQDDLPVAGDWNGDGRGDIALFNKQFKQETYFQMDSNLDGRPDRLFGYGRVGDRPLVGDWNGDGRDGVAVVGRTGLGGGRDWRWSFDDNLDGAHDRVGVSEPSRLFSTFADVKPEHLLAGDWDGDRRDGIAFFDGGRWKFDNNLDGFVDHAVRKGVAGDLPVAGDWDGDGRDGIAIFRNGEWHFDNNTDGLSERAVRFGGPGDRPVVGDWDGDRRDDLSLYR